MKYLAVVLLFGCTQPYSVLVPMRSDAKNANCIVQNYDGSYSLKICKKPIKEVSI
jgi:hypothetical protein